MWAVLVLSEGLPQLGWEGQTPLPSSPCQGYGGHLGQVLVPFTLLLLQK